MQIQSGDSINQRIMVTFAEHATPQEIHTCFSFYTSLYDIVCSINDSTAIVSLGSLNPVRDVCFRVALSNSGTNYGHCGGSVSVKFLDFYVDSEVLATVAEVQMKRYSHRFRFTSRE